MFGIQTLLATGFGTLFIYVMIGIAVFGIAYYFYRRWHHQHRLEQNSEFADIRHARAQRAAQVQEHTVDALRIQQNADQILTGIQQQQAHLESLITEFESALKNTDRIDMRLGKTDTDLQQSVISPFGALLQKMQTYHTAISAQLLRLSTAYSESNQALVARQEELAQIVRSFTEIESTVQVGISQLNTIPAIHQSLTRKTERIKLLEMVLTDLTKKTKELLEINQSQQGLIAILKNPTSETKPSQSDQRKSLPSDYKYSNHLFLGRRASGSGSKKNPYIDHLKGLF